MKLRELLSKMVAYAESQYTVTNEVSIYEKLLSFEDTRISTNSMPVRNFSSFMTLSEPFVTIRGE